MKPILTFFRVFTLFDKREKRNSVVLLFLIVIGALLETIGVSAILPFIGVISKPESIIEQPILAFFYKIPMFNSFNNFVILICICLFLFYILKSVYALILIYLQNRFALNRQIKLAKRLFTSYLRKPYTFFFERNSAELQRNVNTLVVQVISGLFLQGLSLFTELLIIIFIVIVLFVSDVLSASLSVILFGGFSIIFYSKIKRLLDKFAKEQNTSGIEMIKSVTEGIGSIKEIKVLGREKNFIEKYNKFNQVFAKSYAANSLVNQSPRLIIENLAILGIMSIVVLKILGGADVKSVVPKLALFAMAAFRIMPSMNRLVSYITNMRFNAVYFDQIYDDLKMVKEDGSLEDEIINVKKDNSNKNATKSENCFLEIKNLTYRYPNTTEDILKNVNFIVKKNQSVGIIGQSGAGKTTLIDIILGLLFPQEGSVASYGENIANELSAWRKNIGYVPQKIYIIDDTIAKNVAYGIPEKDIDSGRILAVLEIAQMKEFVEKLPQSINTMVGESGMRLSGGQRQRIGIARALYHDPELLILDEATSSLDTEIEKSITDAINNIGHTKTMIIIAHRLNTLEKCDNIYKVESKRIEKVR